MANDTLEIIKAVNDNLNSNMSEIKKDVNSNINNLKNDVNSQMTLISTSLNKQMDQYQKQTGIEFKNLKSDVSNINKKVDTAMLQVESINGKLDKTKDTIKLELKNKLLENYKNFVDYANASMINHKEDYHLKSNGNGFIKIKLPYKIAGGGGLLGGLIWLIIELWDKF